MSSSELAAAGILALDDHLDHVETDTCTDSRSSAPPSETKASVDVEHHTNTPTSVAAAAFQGRQDLLEELRKVHDLDELIIEENLKIHELRCSREKPNEELPAGQTKDTTKSSSMNREREAFRLQLEKERIELDNLEKSLHKDKIKKNKDKLRKVVKCSIMEKARCEIEEDRALCDGLLSTKCDKLERTTSHVPPQDTCEAEDVPATVGPDVAELVKPQDSDGQHASQSEDHCSEEESADNETTVIGTCDLKEYPEEIQSQGYICVRESDRPPDNATICKPEASLTPETRPDDGAFDPGGKAHSPPVPEPKTAPPMNGELTEQESPHSSDISDELLDSACGDLTLTIRHKENMTEQWHNNNNNNNRLLPEQGTACFANVCETTCKDEGDATVLQPVDESPASPGDECAQQPEASQLPPGQPVSCAGRAVQGEDLSDGLQAMRLSGSRLSGIPAQVCMRQVTIYCDTWGGHRIFHKQLFL